MSINDRTCLHLSMIKARIYNEPDTKIVEIYLKFSNN